MSDDSMSDLFVMASDLNNLDPKGLEEFRNAFSEKLTPPTDVYKAGEKAITKVFGIALTSLAIVIFLIILVLVMCATFGSWISVGTALLIILFVVFAFWLGYLLFSSSMENELDNIAMDINKKVGNYSEKLLEEVLVAVKNGASAYTKVKKEKNSKLKEEEDVGPPLD